MVQKWNSSWLYGPGGPTTGTQVGTQVRAPGKEYWKLVHHPAFYNLALKKTLRSARFPHPKFANKHRLQQLHLRAQRGFVSYDACQVSDLRRFCNDRGLVIPLRAKKQDLVALLEQADEDATFDRFMDLPPELRVLIYEFHFESFNSDVQGLAAPYEPPITSVSGIVRRESLPVFYQVCTFEVKVCKADRLSGPDTDVFIINPMAKFLRSAPDELIAMIRKIHFKLLYLYDALEWSAELAGDKKPATLKGLRFDDITAIYSHAVEQHIANLESILQAFLHNLSTRPEGKLLMRDDLKSITQAIKDLNKRAWS